jgi:hypothetical protein
LDRLDSLSYSISMFSAAALWKVANEVVVFLCGALLVLVAVTGRFGVNRQSQAWIALGAFLFVIGVRAMLRAGRYVTRWQHYVRGGSFVLAGLLMLTITLASDDLTRPLLIAAGAVLAARGLINAVLVVRSP